MIVEVVETAAADRVGAEQDAGKIVWLDGHRAEDVEIAAADVEVKNRSVGFTIGVRADNMGETADMTTDGIEQAVDDKTKAVWGVELTFDRVGFTAVDVTTGGMGLVDKVGHIADVTIDDIVLFADVAQGSVLQV